MNGRLSNPSSGANASEEAADANLPEPITSREAPCEIIFSEGDIILNCIPAPSSPGPHRPASRFRTTSTTLKTASDYFKVLLDPAKFQEGRQFLETIDALRVQYGSVELALRRAEIDELPQVTLELPPISSRVNQVALLGDFLRLLADSPFTNTAVPETIAKKPISFLASLAALLDRYGARHILNQALKAHEPGDDSLKLADGASERQRLRHRLQTFRSDDEERVREAIFLAQCLRDSKAFGLLTHKLVVSGSREWAQGFDERQAGIDRPIWWQLSGSVEGRQLIMFLFVVKITNLCEKCLCLEQKNYGIVISASLIRSVIIKATFFVLTALRLVSPEMQQSPNRLEGENYNVVVPMRILGLATPFTSAK